MQENDLVSPHPGHGKPVRYLKKQIWTPAPCDGSAAVSSTSAKAPKAAARLNRKPYRSLPEADAKTMSCTRAKLFQVRLSNGKDVPAPGIWIDVAMAESVG